MARLCTALLSHPQLPGVCSTELGNRIRKACCLATRCLAQMAGAWAESGPVSPGRDASRIHLPFSPAPQGVRIHKTEQGPLQLVLCWLLCSTGLWMDGKVTRNRIENNGLRVQRKGRDLVVGFLPSLIVFILKMIPNSWAGDHLACVPGAARG